MYNKILKRLFSLLIATAVFGQSWSQVQGSINLGPDIVIPTCSTSAVIHANITLPSLGTSNYTLAQITYNPYAFTPGTIIPIASDDLWSGIIPIPFDFCFFNNIYNQCVVGSNGLISFNTANAGQFCPWSFAGVTPLPNATFAPAQNAIMSPYHDLYPPAAPGVGGSISYQVFGTAPNRVFVVSWNLMPMFQQQCNILLNTQQIALYETTNVIETYISNKDLCNTWNGGQAIHGIQNQTGTVAVIVPGRNLPTQWVTTNDAWRWTPQAGGPGGGPAGYIVNWYNSSNQLLASGQDSLVVSLTSSSETYYAEAVFALCSGFEYAYDTIVVTKQPPIVMNVSNIVDVNCYGESNGSFNVTASGGSNSFNYTLNGNATSGGPQNNLIAGIYTVQATDQYGCTNSTVVTINQPPDLTLTVVQTNDVLCKYQNTGQVHLAASGGSPGYVYWYDNTTAVNYSNFDTLFAGNHTFYVMDTHGCIEQVDQMVNQPDSILIVSLKSQEATCINKKDGWVEATPSGGTPNYSYQWTYMDNKLVALPPTQIISDLPTGVYHVTVTDGNDCISATQIQVEQQLCCQLFMPTAFTPNNDTKNDVYRIVHYGGGVTLGHFRIYNRWGQEVFASRDVMKGWDGSFKGTPQNPDTYHYIVEYQCNDKGVITQKIAKGDFILLR